MVAVQGNGVLSNKKQMAKDFFELGEAFAFSQTAFSHVRYQAQVYGGQFERACLEIEDKFKRIRSLSDERLDAALVQRDLVNVNMELQRLECNVVSVFLVSRNSAGSGFDVAG